MTKIFKVGQLVRRSDDFRMRNKGRQGDQLGIVLDIQPSWEGEDHPLVHWEGEAVATLTHPNNLDAVDRSRLRITPEDG